LTKVVLVVDVDVVVDDVVGIVTVDVVVEVDVVVLVDVVVVKMHTWAVQKSTQARSPTKAPKAQAGWTVAGSHNSPQSVSM
jgi:hypothetical protein